MGRKKDGNERHKPFGVCRSYKVIMKWQNGRIVKKNFSKDNEGSEISKTHNVHGILFLEI